MTPMNDQDIENLLTDAMKKLEQEGPLKGLTNTKSDRENIVKAAAKEFKDGKIEITKESLKDPKMLTLICATLVKAAVAEKFDPKGMQPLNMRINNLTPDNKKDLKDRMQQLVNPKKSKNPQANAARDDMVEVFIVDSAGNILGDTGSFDRVSGAFIKLENIQARDPDESKFSLYIQGLLADATRPHLALAPSLNPYQSKL